MGEYVSPFGNKTAPRSSGGSGGNYISPFKGSQYTEDYWKKKQKSDQQAKIVEDANRKAQEQDNAKKAADQLAQKQRDDWSKKNWFEKGIAGVVKAFTPEGIKQNVTQAASDTKKYLVDEPIKSAQNAVAQAQMGQRGAGDQRTQQLIDSRNKWAQEDFKAGKISQQQRDKMIADNNKRLQNVQGTTKKLEKEFGRKYNQDQGAIDAVSTITAFDGLPSTVKGGAKVVSDIAGNVSNRMTEKALAKESKTLFDGIDKSVSKAAQARTPKPIQVTGESLGNEKVGVTTPVRPGIRQESSTYTVKPRISNPVSSEDYTKRFDRLSKAYDKDVRALENKGPLAQQEGMKQIDNKYRVLMDQLDKEYKSGVMSPKTVITKVSSKTSKAEKTTGGAPTEGVNAKSVNYNVESKRSTVMPKEARTKLKDAGYTSEEADQILQDALPDKALTMPGSPKKIKLDDASIKEAATNFDKQNGAVIPEPKTSIVDKLAGTKPAEYFSGDKQRVIDAQAAKQGTNLTPLSATPTSEQGVSKLATSVQQKAVQDKIISKTEAEASNMPTYNKANMKEQATYATDLIKNDPQNAIDIAMGRKAPPEHVLPQMVFNAVEEHARSIGGKEGAQLLKDLSSSKQVSNLTTMAQNVRAAAERDPHSPVTMMNEVKLQRAQALEKRGKSIAKESSADKKIIKQATPKVKKEDWDSFIKGIQC